MLYNDDLAPAKEREWGAYSLFCMWMSDIHSVGEYTLPDAGRRASADPTFIRHLN